MMQNTSAASDLVNAPHKTQAALGAPAEASLQVSSHRVTTASALGGEGGQEDAPVCPSAAGAAVAVTLFARSLSSSRSRSEASTTPPPPPLVRSAKKAVKAGGHGCAPNGVVGGVSLFREWSTNATLLDEALNTPFFHILPKSTESTAGTVAPSAAAHDHPALQSVTLPTSDAPPPSILLIALADVDVLQQSFGAHTLVNPVKNQLAEFKRLVAASMRSELTDGHERPHTEVSAEAQAAAAAVAEDVHADHSAVGGEGEKAAGTAMHDDDLADESALIVSSSQAHDATVRAALRTAHGFLYGSETVPVGVPVVHLQRARREWLMRYRVVHVQPHLQRAQRGRYEAWAQQHLQIQDFAGGSADGDGCRNAASALQSAMTPVSMCAALQPTYWRTVSMERPSVVPTTTHPGTENTSPVEVGGAAGGHSVVPLPTRRLWSSSSAHSASPLRALSSAKTTAVPVLYKAVWDVDLYDDLGLVVSAEQLDSMMRQATSRTAVEAMERDELAPQFSTAAAACASFASPMELSALPPLIRAGDLTQMQLTLPVFVYIVSRYLFIAHYAAYFPTGLFSRALIDPFYFPDAAQCTPEYALRAAPALRREAERVYASYAARLADAHRCFPDRTRSTEVPLPPNDMFHLWELLCPPQRQDVAGRWNPIPWGQLMPEEEEALLNEEFKSVARAGQDAIDMGVSRDEPLLSYSYARAARLTYRQRLQQLAQHPSLLAEVHRLLSQCEDIAMQFFTMVDMEQKGCITWEAFTNALIEEADVQDHQRKVRDRAATLTRTSASIFDRYVVEPLPSTLARLGYTGNVFEVRHSASLVMLEGANDYAVCDGTQLGSIHQRFLVRPVEVLCEELEEEPHDAFGRLIHGPRGDRGGGGGEIGRRAHSATDTEGYDVALRQRPWRNNQRLPRVYVRYEDGRRLQESTALSMLQQLSSSTARAVTAAGREAVDDHESVFTSMRAHQPAKLVSLEGILVVENVSPCVPCPVFVAHGSDMLLRLYSSSRAVQALPEAGALRCPETVTSMEWASGGRRARRSSVSGTGTTSDNVASRSAGVHGDGRELQGRRSGSAAQGDHTLSSTVAPLSPHRRTHHDRISVQREEYLLLGTRDGTILLVDLYAILNRVPRLAAPADTHSGSTVDGVSSSAPGDDTGDVGGNDGAAGTMGAGSSVMQSTSERIGTSENAWSGYRDLACRTYYGDIGAFIVHTHQVHTPGTLVSSVVAAATNGLVVSSGLDGDVFTMRLAYLPSWITATGTQRAPSGVTAGVGPATTDTSRPVVCIEVLHRIRVSDTGVRYALPIPFLSMLAVLTTSNKVYLYHTSVLPTAPALVDGGRSDSASMQVPPAPLSTPRAVSEVREVATDGGFSPVSATSSATPPRLELYDAAAPHLGSIVAMILVKELDQLITVDSSGYVKVWSLRQTQPLTSFYAWAPLNISSSGSGVGDAGRLAGWSPSQGSSAAHCGNGRGSSMSACGVLTSSSALLRTTKTSIEAAVDAAEYRMQPCRSAAFNYAGRQLFVMGTHNAAHCFFVSGQSSSRAHTQPLRALLMDTATVSRVGCVNHRLISLSSADCRVWSLLTGAMELGISANSAEYRRLFNNRLTGKAQGRSSSIAKSVEQQVLSRKGGRDGRSSGSRPRSSNRTRMHNAHDAVILAAASASTKTTGEPQRLLPPSVDDVMRAVSARPWSSHRRSHHHCAPWRTAGAAVGPRREAAVATATASFQLLTAGKQPHGSAEAPGNSGGTAASAAGQAGCAEDDTSELVTNAMRDQNLLLSDIRCACLGPGGEWVGYALLHGDIRLHRSDSGRLLHTFITTSPSTEDLIEAAMQYQHLFTSFTAAHALPPLHTVTMEDAATTASSISPGMSTAYGGSGGGVSGSLSSQSPTVRLTPMAYAKAVALVLERLLATTIGVTCGPAGAAPASAMSADVDDQRDRNVHREPLHMLYLDASQELLVTYADGLLRCFTLLSHSSTATRVIVSRTLMNRALTQVRLALTWNSRHAVAARPATAAGTYVPGRRSTSLNASLSAFPLRELLMTGSLRVAGLGDAEVIEDRSSVVAAERNAVPPSRATCSEGAGGGGPTERLNNAGAAVVIPAASPANVARAVMVSLSTCQIEPDVVLLATASSPLGLICLVHASGLVTVLDVQSRSETGGAARMRMMLGDADDVKGGVGGGCAGQKPEGGRGRAEAGVVVHSFMTTDEVTAVMFLGAYPCLVLADRQHQLSFHLMKGSSLLALLGPFVEELEKDVMAGATGFCEQAEAEANGSATARPSLTGMRRTSSYTAAGLSPRPPPTGRVERGAARGSNPTAASSTLVWTFSVADTCASQRSLGYVTALTFDALYATVYVGTSQGYIVSYLVRRFLMAFQLTPVFLRGVDGMAVSTYAAELQRTLSAACPGASPDNNPSSSFLHNYLRVVFDVPQSVATQVTDNRLRSPRKRHVSLTGNPSTGTTAGSQSPKELGGLIGVYRCRRDLFHVSWRGITGKRRGGGGNGRYAAAPSQAIPICTSSEALIAAAVLHDAVTRMMTVASACATATEACAGTTATPGETQPWWYTPAGRTVKEYVTRKCRGGAARGGVGESAGAANANPTDSGELELDAEGVQLLRGWVNTVLAEQRRYLPRPTSDAEAVSEGQQQRQRQRESFSTAPAGPHDGVSRTSSTRSLSSSGFTAVPLVPTPDCGHDAFASGVSHAGADEAAAADAVGEGAATAASQTVTAQQLAEALVREVQEELLFGKEAPATAAAGHYGNASMLELTTPAATPPHPITDSWVEPLFTRQVMCTTSRSPLCLLTPPAMLERARRERQDRRGRMAATTAAAAAAGNAAGGAPAIPEWNAYVEGALPDYLADLLGHPSQMLTEGDRQALQQLSITVLQCRRNGYLCVGHADGGVTLWTPYACARLESLCPSTSLAATLDRLAASVKAQFHCLHERILLERQRLAFEGSLRNSRHTEEERVACMKHRIRAMLLEHHLTQLQLKRTEGEGEEDADTLAGRVQAAELPSMLSVSAKSAIRPRTWSSPDARRRSSHAAAAAAKVQGSEKCSTATQPFMCGSMETELLAMRPLLCLLLGVSSPAELRARQLSLEDLFFLPFKTRNLASLEAFDPHSYDVAVGVAMRRLRRDLIEEAEEHATEEPDGAPQLLPDALTAAVTQAVSTVSHPVTSLASPASPLSLSGSAGRLRRRRQESVYNYRLSSLARAWDEGADQPQRGQSSDASGAAVFPGVLHLLLHRAMERAPHLSNGAAAANSSLTAASAATPVNSGKAETAHDTAAHAAGAQSPSPTPAAIADGTAPADGEYYEVCHALQMAEVQAESQWEVEELGRAWRRLGASTVAATASSTSAGRNSLDGRVDVCKSPPTQLPLSSAAAVSAAVNRQLKRTVEARIAALSHRAVAVALLRNVQLCCRPAHTRAAPAPPPVHPGDGASGAYSAWPPTASRRGGGLAWVQGVLCQQAQQAFKEPLLTWLQFASSSVYPAGVPIRYGSTCIDGQQRGSAVAATGIPVLSGEERLLSSPTNASLQALCHTYSMPGDGGDDPHAAPAEGRRESKKAFLTEVPGDATGADAAVGSSLRPPERATFGASGHTAVVGGADRKAGQRSLSSRLSSAADRPPLCDVGTALSSRDSCSPLLSPLPPLKSTRASAISGRQLSSLGVYDACAMTAHRGNPAASAMADTASIISRSASSTSSLSVPNTPPNAALSSPAVRPTPQVRPRLLTSSALHWTKLANTGSCGHAPRQQRPATTGVVGRRGAAGDYTVVTDTLHAAAAGTIAPPATSTGYGGGRGGGAGGRGGARGSRAAAVQSFTYYSLFGHTGTTK